MHEIPPRSHNHQIHILSASTNTSIPKSKANENTRFTQIKPNGGKIYQYKKAEGGFVAGKLKPRLDERTCNNSAGNQLDYTAEANRTSMQSP
nr:hypothetical protein Itr_chr10CG15890 [Ipomoea trifida]